MSQDCVLRIIAYIYNDYSGKFGIPRQSGLVDGMDSLIVFEPEYRDPSALRGLEQYSHLWLLWQFSEVVRKRQSADEWSPTVRPPKLGGNTRMGVFATRSPNRPNPIGLSSVKLVGVDTDTEYGPVLHVTGADLMNGTPIYDIKPYLPYTDSHPGASGGFALQQKEGTLDVVIPPELLQEIPAEKQDVLIQILAQDPRPSYQNAPDRMYYMPFGSLEIGFTVSDTVLTVHKVQK
ncbi:MAG: tRNA (N6-threonylcarbamoyladenosine(37)-N6)-methyltransferase TrmO [Clostridia bacterium]|nr:tRNA (N6-threonylcarbamoyladenosine(37)-N6)-methyltransferase TrmO [Clostridia bacterium]